MARKRFLDQSFFTNPETGRLTPEEQMFLVACFINADDEGRLEADPALLARLAFTYKTEVSADQVHQMRDDLSQKLTLRSKYAFVVYDEGPHEYIAFTNWEQTNKPSHPKASDYPPPPSIHEADRELPEVFPKTSRSFPEDFTKHSGELPEDFTKTSRLGQVGGGEVRSGQVRLGQDRLGQGSSALSAEFRDEVNVFLSNRLTDFDDLIDHDFLMFADEAEAGHIQKAASFGLNWWSSKIGELNGRRGKSAGQSVLKGLLDACRGHSPPLIAAALLKTARYEGGASKSWGYVEQVMKEMNGNGKT